MEETYKPRHAGGESVAADESGYLPRHAAADTAADAAPAVGRDESWIWE